jgi:hypothetical protein
MSEDTKVPSFGEISTWIDEELEAERVLEERRKAAEARNVAVRKQFINAVNAKFPEKSALERGQLAGKLYAKWRAETPQQLRRSQNEP